MATPKTIPLGKEISFLLLGSELSNTYVGEKGKRVSLSDKLKEFLAKNHFRALFNADGATTTFSIFINRVGGKNVSGREMKFYLRLNEFKVFILEEDVKVEKKKITLLYKKLAWIAKKINMVYVPVTYGGSTFFLKADE